MMRQDWVALWMIGGMIVAGAAAVISVGRYIDSFPLQPSRRIEARITGHFYDVGKYSSSSGVNAVTVDGRVTSSSAPDHWRCHVGDRVDVIEQGITLEVDPATCRPSADRAGTIIKGVSL